MANVTLKGVSKIFPGGVKAVDQVDLEVGSQEFIVLVGPSGCGKTTTLRMIAGLDAVSEGEIRIGDRVVNQVPPKDRNIAMVFQNYALYPHMTVYKNLAFGLRLRYGGDWFTRIGRRLTNPSLAAELAAQRRGIGQQVRQTAKMLGIEHLLQRMPRQLSGGERQRVALGRAIVRKPAAFLFDEPLSNLDAKLRVEMRHELKRLHRRLQATMVYVTHDQVEALTLGQRVVVMDRGRVQQAGSPREVYDHPRNRFVASFIGSPPMNFVEGQLEQMGQRVRFVGGALRARFSIEKSKAIARMLNNNNQPRAVVLGIRPEAAAIDTNWTTDRQREDHAQENQRQDNELPSEQTSQAVVNDVELLGDATVLQVDVIDPQGGPQPRPALLIKTDARTTFSVGDTVKVAWDMQRAHLFDPDTGNNLMSSESD